MENVFDFTDGRFTLTRQQAAVALNISIPTLNKIIHNDDSFPVFHIGKRVYVNKTKLEEWTAKQSAERNIVSTS